MVSEMMASVCQRMLHRVAGSQKKTCRSRSARRKLPLVEALILTESKSHFPIGIVVSSVPSRMRCKTAWSSRGVAVWHPFQQVPRAEKEVSVFYHSKPNQPHNDASLEGNKTGHSFMIDRNAFHHSRVPWLTMATKYLNWAVIHAIVQSCHIKLGHSHCRIAVTSSIKDIALRRFDRGLEILGSKQGDDKCRDPSVFKRFVGSYPRLKDGFHRN